MRSHGCTVLEKGKARIMELLLLLLAIILLNIATRLWGIDSRDGINSKEWELRQLWPGFH
jgi:hypothetical protein